MLDGMFNRKFQGIFNSMFNKDDQWDGKFHERLNRKFCSNFYRRLKKTLTGSFRDFGRKFKWER